MTLLLLSSITTDWAWFLIFTRFLDHTQRRTTVGRSPLNEGSVRRRDLYLTTQQSQQTNIHAPRRAEDFYLPLKIRRLRPGLNPRTWVPKASTLPLDHRSSLVLYMCTLCDSRTNINTLDNCNRLTFIKCKHTKRLLTAFRRHLSKLRSKRRNA